jgi:hypothetical protein
MWSQGDTFNVVQHARNLSIHRELYRYPTRLGMIAVPTRPLAISAPGSSALSESLAEGQEVASISKLP